jgi:EmrB/QacA subfamily drug resistance transporter
LSPNQLRLITLGIMLSIFLASVEGTIVATAMPTIVGQLGGLSIYSWVFAIFMLTSTTTVPLYGKLSDVFGRKQVYLVSMSLFLVGSVLCGLAKSMEQLIFFRAVQGIGAGGVLPLTFTIIGDLFSLKQRARMQGLFSGVWGVSSIIGPLIGGFLVDQISWKWVFFINIVPGLIAMALVWFPWKDTSGQQKVRPSIDYAGAALLTLGVISLLMGLEDLGQPMGVWLLGASLVLFAALAWVEIRATDPILPLPLFRGRLFNISILHGILAGAAMFGSLTYVPLFVQAVLGTSATQAGLALTPMSLAWTFASILAGYLLLKVGYRALALVGMVLVVIGAFFMSQIGAHSNYLLITFYLSIMGLGMGLSIPAFLIAVQSNTRKRDLGVATSTLQFSRSIGGTLGVSILGVFLSSKLASQLTAAGLDPAGVSLDTLLDPVAQASASLAGPVRDALAVAIAYLFLVSFIVAILGLVVVMFTPSGKIAQLEQNRAAD